METVTERSSVPPPLPPKTRKSITITNGAPPTVKTTVFGGDVVVNGFSEARTSITNDNHHVVKIRINPTEDETLPASQRPGNVQQHPSAPVLASFKQLEATKSLTFQPSFSTTTSDGCIRISVSSNDVEHQEDMVRNTTSIPSTFIKTTPERGNPYFFYSPFPSNVMSSGQSSPSDTLDSGTCSDLDGSTPPPLPKKKSATSITSQATVTVIVNGSTGAHRRTGSLTSSGAEVDSDDDEGSNISCDSLNSSDLNAASNACSISNGGEVSIPEEDEEVEIVQAVNTTKINNDIVEAVNTVFVGESKEKDDIGAQKSLFLASIINPPPLKPVHKPPTPPAVPPKTFTSGLSLPEGLLQDIRDRTAKLTVVPSPCSTLTRKTRTWVDDMVAKSLTNKSPISTLKLEAPRNGVEEPAEKTYPSLSSSIVEEKTYEDRKKETEEKKQQEQLLNELFPKKSSMVYETDRFYKFHLNEHVNGSDNVNAAPRGEVEEIETFAGVRDYLHEKEPSSTIRSAKGTVRGVKNRVRAGIATFLQMQNNKSYKEKEAGKVVVYTTTMGVVRETYQGCVLVKKILRNLMVKYEERDVFMSRDTQTEIRERMGFDEIVVPQVFVEGQHIGNAETVERLNESGELRRIMKPFKSADAVSTCQVCGGYRLLPCSICNGSKKSVHRNHFTAEFVALKCMHCDEVGLVRCHAC